MEQKRIRIKIRRFPVTPEGVKDSYEVPLEDGMSVLNVLEFIARNVDSTLAYYGSCKVGKCMGCTLKINGKRGLACATLVDGDLSLEADDRYPVIRDLVVDMGEL